MVPVASIKLNRKQFAQIVGSKSCEQTTATVPSGEGNVRGTSFTNGGNFDAESGLRTRNCGSISNAIRQHDTLFLTAAPQCRNTVTWNTRRSCTTGLRLTTFC